MWCVVLPSSLDDRLAEKYPDDSSTLVDEESVLGSEQGDDCVEEEDEDEEVAALDVLQVRICGNGDSVPPSRLLPHLHVAPKWAVDHQEEDAAVDVAFDALPSPMCTFWASCTDVPVGIRTRLDGVYDAIHQDTCVGRATDPKVASLMAMASQMDPHMRSEMCAQRWLRWSLEHDRTLDQWTAAVHW
jgi:hypothetical protein